ncbi:MAG: NAD(P)-dependent oxidoreductase [Dehalococcoidales bacterium]|nr:MAG: NAD(P)-dependent oxidoreductase [Dehalococcoidales bacterium]
MDINTVGLLSPGDMGHAVGAVLVTHGIKVITCLEGRSNRTCELAEKAGIQDVSTYENLVRDADIILSILVPSEAKNAATLVSRALKDTGEKITFTDCNAIAPQTAQEIGQIITETGSNFVDAGIIGGPPGPGVMNRIYISGQDTEPVEQLNKHGLDIRVIGPEIGQASGIKMVYAALTKGTSALALELLVAAKRLNLYDALISEWEMSQVDRYESFKKGLQSVPSKSHRWIGEMEEIAKTFGHVGLTPKILEGAADMYRFIRSNPVSDETPETIDRNRTLEQLIDKLAE